MLEQFGIVELDIFTMLNGETVLKEFTFDGHDELQMQVVDVITKQQLDRITIQKNNDRDLGGLF